LGDPTRLEVVNALLRAGPATASQLAKQLPVTRQAVGKHLGVLEAVGLVARSQDGRAVLFTIQEAVLEQARLQMAGIAAEWDRRLSVLKELAEAPASE
jgi:DNA-binding transcriptional ArsR family regulator